MFGELISVAYTIAAVFFIFSMAGLSKYETSRQGNSLGIIGMVTALIATVFNSHADNLVWVIVATIIGGVIGIYLAKQAEMTKIPELVAILHSFTGLAAILIGLNSYGNCIYQDQKIKSNITIVHLIEIFLGIFIGAVTLTGSAVAFGKLSGKIPSKPMVFLNRYKINLMAILTFFLLLMTFIISESKKLQILVLLMMIIIALAFGWHLVISIGGADMPVIISVMNSYSGWAAAVTGFVLSNDMLIITGALVGSAGAILSYIMCKSMNRSFISIVIGSSDKKSFSYIKNVKEESGYRKISVEDTAKTLKGSRNVIIIPGYGMAVAQAQYPIAKITEKLRSLGIEVRFGIHPVAGRLPGHMNVLLAEAKVPYEVVLEMEDINNDFTDTDTVLIIGANDTVNPEAQNDSLSPIAGMPVLEAWKANCVIVLKRSMNTGYSGVQNPLFFRENTYMLFGDAKVSADAILKAL